MINHQIDSSAKSLKITVPGDILSTNVGQYSDDFSKIIEAESKSDWSTMEIDLSNTKMVDSTGLNFLITVVKKLQSLNKSAKALITNANVNRTFVFTRLDQHIDVVYSPA